VTRLTPVSYIVLGLVARHGPATPYQLKTSAASSIGNFWSVQHAQLYSEPERLARAGLLDEEREEGGRRRRTYTLTAAGRAAVDEWLGSPAPDLGELRSPGLLQLFFGADPARLGAVQVELHERKLAEYEALHAEVGQTMPEGVRLALEAGIAHEREWLRFWSGLAARNPG
jgi:PadR family transcriptional regulator, regulatory protein AphA